MPIIEHRAIISSEKGSSLITLPAGHTIMTNSKEVRLIIANNIIVVSDSKVPLERIKTELEYLYKDLG